MGFDLFTKRCGCGAIHPVRQSCTACIDRKREQAVARGGERTRRQPSMAAKFEMAKMWRDEGYTSDDVLRQVLGLPKASELTSAVALRAADEMPHRGVDAFRKQLMSERAEPLPPKEPERSALETTLLAIFAGKEVDGYDVRRTLDTQGDTNPDQREALGIFYNRATGMYSLAEGMERIASSDAYIALLEYQLDQVKEPLSDRQKANLAAKCGAPDLSWAETRKKFAELRKTGWTGY